MKGFLNYIWAAPGIFFIQLFPSWTASSPITYTNTYLYTLYTSSQDCGPRNKNKIKECFLTEAIKTVTTTNKRTAY